ncbi:uncharacterized protein LOC142628960 [Castanea sativa]|uniref:uncharacterized protein LOC142628960 n=1 Tax=Castanea sativa TaxID=21020 RepID=UPI003F649BEE
MALERQVQTLAEAVERLTRQNQDLEEQLRQRNAHQSAPEEDQEGASPEGRNAVRPEGSNAPTRPERQDTNLPSVSDALPPHIAAEMQQMRERMDAMMSALRGRISSDLDDLVHRTNSPFTALVNLYPLPPKFRMPHIENYDGSKDPLDHLESFRTLMHLQGVPDEIMCRAFLTTLKGPVRDWYSRLTPNSISTFKELGAQFVSHFIGNHRHKKSIACLLNIKQREDETLRLYLDRFNKESLSIKEADDKILVVAFTNGLRKGKFLFSLYKNDPKTMSDVFYRATKYMNAEDALLAREDKPRKRERQEDAQLDRPRKMARTKELRDDRRPKPPTGRFTNFTPLNAPIDQQIKALIRRGRLQRFVNKERAYLPQNQAPRQDNDHPRQLARDIRMIVGGTVTVGSSKKARKTYLRTVQNVQMASPALERSRIDNPTIEFSEGDARRLHHPHDDVLVVTIQVGDYNIHRVLVDNGSSADILYYPAFQQMGIGRERLIPTNAPLVGFGGARILPLGIVTLAVTIGDYPQQVTRNVTFLVVDCLSAYNAIIGRPTLNSWKAVTSTYHLMIKFPTDHGIGELRGDQVSARECYVAMMEMDNHIQAMNIEERRVATEPAEKLEDVLLDKACPERTTKIGTLASSTVRQELANFLKENRDVFAWSHEDMLGIDPSVMVHRLNVSPSFPPVRQKKRTFAQERDQAAAEEVHKLQEAGFIREVYYPDWYNQIRMDEADQEKTSFVTSQGLFCYKVMPFGLKNAGATYQRLMNKMFTRQTGRNVQVYVDDMLVKSQREEAHLEDLKETVAALSRFVSKAADRCLPFFRTLKKSFEWTAECQQAFEDLKVYLFSPQLLSPSQPGEELFLYLAVSQAAVSAALIREDDKIQRPVYYASKALHGAEERYPPMEKLAFALVTAARKLKPYFQAHTIVVLIDKPLRRAMGSPTAAGRMTLWSIELSEFDIQYRPRTAIKGQVVADFIAEFTSMEDREEISLQWIVFTDGSSNKKAGGVGVVLKSPEGDELKCMIHLDFLQLIMKLSTKP